MNPSTLMAIAALFTASCLVRIVPALVRAPLPGSLQRCLERVLPVAVFINFALYIAYSEISRAPLAASLSMLLVAGLALLTGCGLISTAVIGTAAYALLLHLY